MATAAGYVVPLRELTISDVPTVGGKNASLGEMIRELAPLGVRVPDGFAVTADTFRLHLKEAGLTEWVFGELERLDVADTRALAEIAARIRERVTAAPLPMYNPRAGDGGVLGTVEGCGGWRWRRRCRRAIVGDRGGSAHRVLRRAA